MSHHRLILGSLIKKMPAVLTNFVTISTVLTRFCDVMVEKYHYDDRGSAPARGVGGGAGTEAEVHNEGTVYLYGLVYTHRTEPRRFMIDL